MNIVTASIRFGIKLVGSGCEGWKEKVQHHLSSPAKTNGTLIHLVFLVLIFLHLLYSLFSLSLSFPPLSLSPILLLQGTVWTTAPVCSPVIFLFRCRWIFVIWNSLQYISLHTVPKMFIIHAASEWLYWGKHRYLEFQRNLNIDFHPILHIAHCPYHQNAHCLPIKRKGGKMAPTTNCINLCVSEVILFSWGWMHIP